MASPNERWRQRCDDIHSVTVAYSVLSHATWLSAWSGYTISRLMRKLLSDREELDNYLDDVLAHPSECSARLLPWVGKANLTLKHHPQQKATTMSSSRFEAEKYKKAVLSQRWPRNAPYRPTWVIDSMNVPTKFEVRSFTRSWDNMGYPKNLGTPWIRPRSLFSELFNKLLFGLSL